MNQNNHRRAWLVFSSIFFAGFSGLIGASSTPDPNKLDSLWVTESESLLKLDVSTGNPLFRIPEIKNATAFAVDEKGGQIWVFSQGVLHQIGLDGTIGLSVPIDPPPSSAPADASVPDVAAIKTALCTGATNLSLTPPWLFWSLADLAVDDDGAVWLGLGTRLYRVSPRGQVTLTRNMQQLVTGVSTASAPAKVSVSLCHRIRAYDENGGIVNTIIVTSTTTQPPIQDIAYDPIDNAVWVVRTDFVRKYVYGGPLLFAAGIDSMNHVASDGHGGAWIAGNTNLRHVAPRGPVGRQIQPLPGIVLRENIIGLAANQRDQSAWVASQKAVAHVSLQGQVLKHLTLDYLGSGPLSLALALGEYADTIPPDINVASPVEGTFTKDSTPSLDIRFNDIGQGVQQPSLAVTINAAPAAVTCMHAEDRADCVLDSDLADGSKDMEVTIADHAGNISEPAHVQFTVDTIPSTITITQPADNFLTNSGNLTIQGSLNEPGSLAVNGTSVSLDASNTFSHAVTLQEGANSFLVVAADRAGNTSDRSLLGALDSVPPALPAVGSISFSPGQDGNIVVFGSAGSVESNARVKVTNTRTGQSVVVQADGNGRFRAEIGGQLGDVLQAQVVDAANNESEEAQLEIEILLPPDPASVASPLSESGITPFHESIAFLYSGPVPIQTGVAAGTIDPVRAAVIRGRVMTRDNNPLPGVMVTIKDHPEFGQTSTRTDGMFDIAVNGGGLLTLDYQKAGYLPIQRQINAGWGDFELVQDVVMIGLDPTVTMVDLSALSEAIVATSSPVSDGDGARQTALMVMPTTTAELVMADGSRQSITTLNIRATEYTVGINGRQAMPGELPPTSGYTYAVELSADEAIAAGAASLQFSRPVSVYLENYLDLPIGWNVPAGWYDREKAAWIAADSGRIVKILAVEEGKAILDVAGTNQGATAADYFALGFTDEERSRLAATYPVGQSLWRLPIPHFSAWDGNFPYRPPLDATEPEQPEPDPENDDKEEEPECEAGSIIECENAVLRETVDLIGTPFSLNYRSDKVPGRKAGSSLTVPVSGNSIPSSLKGIRVDISIAGRHFQFDHPPLPNQSRQFLWDGFDAYGRQPRDGAIAEIQIAYIYPTLYCPGDVGRSFAKANPDAFCTGRLSSDTILTQRYSRRFKLGDVDARIQGLAGWTLSEHHSYNPNDRVLYRGDGITVGAVDTNRVMRALAGPGIDDSDGIPAVQTRLRAPGGVVFGSDGTLYIADLVSNLIRKVNVAGIVTNVAGTLERSFSGDGGPATTATLCFPSDVAISSSNGIFIADSCNHRIRYVNPAGVITTIAGNGVAGFGGDGGSATSASFSSPKGIALAPDGALYIADEGNHRVRRIGPDGIVETVAGTGTAGYSGDGGSAIQANLSYPADVSIAPNGDLYVADYGNHRVRRIAPSGVIATFAGDGVMGFAGDGGRATDANLASPRTVFAASNGAVYIGMGDFAREVTSDGIIRTMAGGGTSLEDGVSATDAAFFDISGFALSPNGDLAIADYGTNSVRWLTRPLPEFTGSDIAIVSSDGMERYHFDRTGRHLETIDILTGARIYDFSYSSAGYLTAISDGDGNITTIERSGATPLAVVSPYGQRTTLTIDGNGFLASIANPAGDRYSFTSSPDGLLATFTDPRQNTSEFTYRLDGRLEKDQNAAGGSWTLTRTEQEGGYTAAITSAAGRTSTYQVEHLATGHDLRTNTAPDGTQTITLKRTSGQQEKTHANGTLITTLASPDPRFGMQSPVTSAVINLPSGLDFSSDRTRSIVLNDPNDPASIVSLTETLAISNRYAESRYDFTSRTWTMLTPAARQAVSIVDEKGRLSFSRFANLEETSFGYDFRGRLQSVGVGSGAALRTTGFAYYASGPSAGFLQEITDAENRAISYEYDLAGRITKQTLADGRFIQYGYDATGNLTSLTPPDREAHIFRYTAVDLEEEYEPPLAATGERITLYDYNLDKDLDLITRPDGQTVDFVYNGPGKKLSALLTSSGSYGYTYSSATGQLETLTAPDGQSLSYGYDGFLVESETADGAVSGTVSWDFDNNLWAIAESVDGDTVSFGYDDDGLLTAAGDETLVRNGGNGLLESTSLGRITTSHGYNTFGELAVESAAHSANVLYEASYPVRDKLGRIKQRSETIEGVTATFDYAYDLAGRLDTVSKDGLLIADYGYDSNGNRTTPSGASIAAYDGQDRLLSYGNNSYTYSANGELLTKTTSGATTVYSYDALGNLRNASLPDDITIEYLIDGRNRRVGKKVNGALVQGFLYGNQFEPVAQLNASNNIVVRFVYGSKEHSPDYMVKDGVTYRIISDYLGSPRLVINSSTGEVVQRMDYSEFGEVILDTNPGFQPFGFAGGIYDQHTKLTRFGARDYDAETGRWTAKDPILFEGGDSNLYGYVLNDPINLVDPSGLVGACAHAFRKGVTLAQASAVGQMGNTAALAGVAAAGVAASQVVGGKGIGPASKVLKKGAGKAGEAIGKAGAKACKVAKKHGKVGMVALSLCGADPADKGEVKPFDDVVNDALRRDQIREASALAGRGSPVATQPK